MQPNQIAEQALQEIATVWQIDHADAVWSENGFDWTPGSHLVRIRASVPDSYAPTRVRLSVETNLLSGVAVGDPKFIDMVSAAAPLITSTYSLVYPPVDRGESSGEHEEPNLTMFSSAYISANLLGWLPCFFAQLAIMQPIDAEVRASALPEALGSGRPAFYRSDKREACDDILEVANEVYRPAGMQSSRWSGSEEFEDFAEEYARSDQCFGNGDPSGLAIEVPFGQNSALIRFWTDQRHPQLGNGLLLTTQLPYWGSAKSIGNLPGILNRWEARSWTDFPQLGCWHTHDSGDDQIGIAHSSFIPNALYRPGLVLNLAAWSAARAASVRREFWRDEEDLPMSKILGARRKHSP